MSSPCDRCLFSGQIVVRDFFSYNKLQRPFNPIETDLKSLGTPLVLSHPLRFVKSSGSYCMVSDDLSQFRKDQRALYPADLTRSLGHGLFTPCANLLAYRLLLRPETFLTHANAQTQPGFGCDYHCHVRVSFPRIGHTAAAKVFAGLTGTFAPYSECQTTWVRWAPLPLFRHLVFVGLGLSIGKL